nr:uncharacterized protein LOC100203711 isoform X1 [Hydra vulgaris]
MLLDCSTDSPSISQVDDSAVDFKNEATYHENADKFLNNFNFSNDHDFFQSLDDLSQDDDQNSNLENSNLEQLSLKDKLILWYIQYNVSKNAFSALLKIIGPDNNLPICAATLLRKIKCYNKNYTNANKSYHYFGIQDNIKNRIDAGLNAELIPEGSQYQKLKQDVYVDGGETLVSLAINVDGVKLQNSTNKSMWPILCRVNESLDQTPFVAGIHIGSSKPDSLVDFFLPFITDFTQVSKNIKTLYPKIRIKILFFVCDAPARAFCKGTKQCGGYFSCDYCQDEGFYIKEFKKIVFSETIGVQRTDQQFSNLERNGHQLRESPLVTIVPMVTCFPPDPMHLLYLGNMRQLLLIWCCEIRGKGRLVPSSKNLLSNFICILGKCLPSEFSRHPRSIDEIRLWKAVELRIFLLFVGPVALKAVLPTTEYNHFMFLHSAIYAFSCDNWKNMIHDGNEALISYVSGIKSLYGRHHLVYNVHVLLHIPEYIEKYVNLGFWSAFWAESYYGVLRKRFRGTSNLLSQAVNRVSELEILNYSQTRRVLAWSKNPNDQFFLTENGIMQLQSLDSNTMIGSGFLMEKCRDFYSYLQSFNLLHIGVYLLPTGHVLKSKVIRKCVAFTQCDNTLIIFPFPSIDYFGK